MQRQIVIVGGGAAGIAAAASLLKRKPDLDIAIIEPRDEHYYQPGWTMVGGGIFSYSSTVRPTDAVIPTGAKRIRAAALAFEPHANAVITSTGERIGYEWLILAPGIRLEFNKIAGLEETLGRNGVTSNYKPGMAPYTWELIQSMNSGAAIFTQPPPPFKCAGAPQKIMYLACDAWRRRGVKSSIAVEFRTAAPSLFGVADYVPALMEYVRRYDAALHFGSTLIAVDGEAKSATFKEKNADGVECMVTRSFDMLHVTPPQSAAECISGSPLADAAGWIDVDQATLRHKRFPNVYGLGDACSAPNAKTAAAARKQAPIVAVNLLAAMAGQPAVAAYNGYGSCPLTVERGRIVLAEFGYGGKLLPTFPKWLNNGERATRLAWVLKKDILPDVYWNYMLKGRETFAEPETSVANG
jgi:sulfide:quinone oxidoreductase